MNRTGHLMLVLAAAGACVGTMSVPADETASSSGSLVCEPWAAVDGLGRRVAGADACAGPRRERYVGIFYFLWLGRHEQRGPHNITQILRQPPADRPWGEKGIFHWWDEPRLGYYLSDDEWVIAKHAQQLADAGVDVVIFDVTNAVTYTKEYLNLCRVYRRLRAQGWKTPQISFLFNSRARETTRRVYEEFYRKNLYPELWFRWKGKPLLLTIPDDLPQEILDFFTIRRSWAWSGTEWFGDGRDKWPWLDHSPQAYGWHEDPGNPEFMPVASAEHPVSSIGRSHRNGRQPPPEEQDSGAGIYFQEQWDHAVKVDPEFIFITGWNEWVAQRFIADQPRRFADGRMAEGGSLFIDQFSREYSRDIEPMRGGFEDNFYYQMVSNIRRFKGVRRLPVYSGYREIVIDGRIEDWHQVESEFLDPRGDTMDRGHAGFAEAGPYLNRWGRNDIVSCRVARDAGHVYFLVRTAAPLIGSDTPDPGWMNLLLGINRMPLDAWEGFQYRLMPAVAGTGMAALCVYREQRWTKIMEVPCAVGNDMIELAFPLERAGVEDTLLELEFKWFDNLPEPLVAIDFMDHGDSAPNNRFRYPFRHVGDHME